VYTEKCLEKTSESGGGVERHRSVSCMSSDQPRHQPDDSSTAHVKQLVYTVHTVLSDLSCITCHSQVIALHSITDE